MPINREPEQGSPSSSRSTRPKKAAPEPASMMLSEGGSTQMVQHNDAQREIAETVGACPLGEGVEAAHWRNHSIVLSSPLPAYPTGTLRVTFEVRAGTKHADCQ